MHHRPEAGLEPPLPRLARFDQRVAGTGVDVHPPRFVRIRRARGRGPVPVEKDIGDLIYQMYQKRRNIQDLIEVSKRVLDVNEVSVLLYLIPQALTVSYTKFRKKENFRHLRPLI